jgi:hypothetical protein
LPQVCDLQSEEIHHFLVSPWTMCLLTLCTSNSL